MATGVLNDAESGAEAHSRARWARGRSFYELARNDEALDEFRAALEVAVEPRVAMRIEVSMSAALMAAGRYGEATEKLWAIVESGDEVLVALARSQLGLLDLSAGRLRAAASALRLSIEPLETSVGDGDAAARAVGNLAGCEFLLENYTEAETLFRRAILLGRTHGERLVVVGCLQNLGSLAARRGHLAEAIEWFSEAEGEYRAIRKPARNLSTLYAELAEAYRIAGLTDDSVRYARAALNGITGGGNWDKLAESKYRLAVCALDAGDAETAIEASRSAAEHFDRAGRTIWVHRAWAVGLEALDQSQSLPPSVLDEARQAVAELAAAGWTGEALRIRNLIGGGLVGRGQAGAEEWLVSAGDSGGDESITVRLERAYAAILSARASEHPLGEALAEANALIVEHQQRLSDPELRAGAARLSLRFRREAVREASGGDPVALLVADERWRALSFDLPRVVPPTDPELAGRSEQLRALSGAVGSAVEVDSAALAEVHRLEQEIRRSALQSNPVSLDGVDNVEQPNTALPMSIEALHRRLGRRTLVEWIPVGDTLQAVRLHAGTSDTWSCGRLADLEAMAEAFRARVGRLLRPGLSSASLERRWKVVRHDARLLGRRLLGSSSHDSEVSDEREIEELVLVPPPSLVPLPWSLLLGDESTPITVAPSATVWMNGDADVIVADAGVVAGSGLIHSGDDITAVQQVFGSGSVLGGATATPEAVRSLLAEVSIVHIAAHGHFRPDSPRFSSLELGPGRVALYEFDGISVPSLVVLAGCDLGRGTGFAGSEILGFAPSFVAAGAAAVVAPCLAIPDHGASGFSASFYRQLPGRSPSAALAAVRSEAVGGSVVDQALAASMLCFGGDCGPVES